MQEKKNFFEGKQYIIYIILGIILFTMVFKSQVLIISYGDDHSMTLGYTVYGYCIRAAAPSKATEAAIYNEVYVFNSYETSVLKAVEQMEALSNSEQPVRIKATGFPRNNEKLEQKIKCILESSGRTVELYDEINSKT